MNITKEIGQAKAATGISIDQSPAIQSACAEQSGVKFLAVYRTFDRMDTEIASRTISQPTANSATSQAYR